MNRARTIGWFLVAATASQVTLAGMDAETFGARRGPVEVVATLNEEPALCDSVLSQMKAQFDSDIPEPNADAALPEGAEVLVWRPIERETVQPSESRVEFQRLDVDLDGTGRTQVLLIRTELLGWGDQHDGLVFPSIEQFEAASPEARESWVGPANGQSRESASPREPAQLFFPAARSTSGAKSGTGNSSLQPRLYRFRGKTYFLVPRTEYERLHAASDWVFRLHADGRVTETCHIEQPAADEAYRKFTGMPGLSSLLSLIHRIGHQEYSGSMNLAALHNAKALAAERRAAVRPWVLAVPWELADRLPDDVSYSRFPSLEDWSYQSAENRLDYQTLTQHFNAAMAGVAAYLMSEFRLSPGRASKAAGGIVSEFVQAWLDDRLDEEFLLDDGADVVKILLTRDSPALSDRLASRATDLPKDVLSAAVEWPDGLERLLRAGADPNKTDVTGKTPLMTAAERNRPDAVRRLLSARANVEASTCRKGSDRCDDITRTKRTAFLYAAENASPLVMKLLLDAGADPVAVDAQGNGMASYLALNPRLTSDERALGIKGLAARAADFAGPGFKCEQARSRVEKAICASEVLRMLDAEQARAFGQLKQRHGGPALAEQRAWLSRRDVECRNDTNCLSDMTGAHVRYLHNRIQEGE